MRIESRLVDMSAAAAKVARTVLAEPTAPLSLSITDLAKRAGTSPATVTRFCRLLGYRGYASLRVAAAADAGRGGTSPWWCGGGVDAPPLDQGPDMLVRTVAAAHLASLQATADGIDLPQALAAARAIAGCEHLDVYGVGGCGPLATELARRLYGIGIPAYAWRERVAAVASAAMPRRGAIAIGICDDAREGDAIEALAVARRSGALTVAITGDGTCPPVAAADMLFAGHAPPGHVPGEDLSSQQALLLVSDLLFLLVARLLPVVRAPSIVSPRAAPALPAGRHAGPATPAAATCRLW